MPATFSELVISHTVPVDDDVLREAAILAGELVQQSSNALTKRFNGLDFWIAGGDVSTVLIDTLGITIMGRTIRKNFW